MRMPEASLHRGRCRTHAQRRCAERGIPLDPDQLQHLERTLERMRPCYEREGQQRYRLVVRHSAGHLRAVYDTRLHCLVTAWPCKWLQP